MNQLAFLAGVGPELSCHHVDADNCTLTRAGSIRLPQNIQYAWPSASGEIIYVATSEGGAAVAGGAHTLTALKLDWRSGSFTVHGPQVTLRARPIHVTLDGAGRHLVTACKPLFSVHRLNGDGTIGAEIEQPADLDIGVYPHQVRVSPSDRMAISASRGYRARTDRNREAQPGALQLLNFEDGRLSNKGRIAPDGGHAFAPRNLDFHPSRPWMYVGLELQNQLQMFDYADDEVSPRPLFAKDTLRPAPLVALHQVVGPVRVHPNGRFVYVANRASGTAEFDKKKCFVGGENSIAAFSINQDSGEPILLQNADTHGIHPRCFGIDPAGRILIAAHTKGAWYRDTSKSVAWRPACLSVFRIGDDGRLTYVRKYDVETGGASMYWGGLVARARQG